MIKFLEKRRILAILLALTILSTVFSSLTMIAPTATTTVEYDIKAVHIARGNAESKATVRAVQFKIADKANIVAGETYTVKMAYTGSHTMTQSTRFLGIRVGGSGTNAGNAKNYEVGTQSGGYEANFTSWTAEITPTASKDMYACFYTGNNQSTVDGYVGAIHVIDKNGNDVAIDLSEITGFYNTSTLTNNNFKAQDDATYPTSKYYETTEVLDVDTLTDVELKQKLINAFYEGDSMLNLKTGTANNYHAIYKKVPADKLVAGTKYKLSLEYTGVDFDNSNFVLIRSGAESGSAEVLRSDTSTTDEVIDHGNHKEYVDYYTVPETPTDLYIGFYLHKDTWATADINLGALKFTDANGKNLITPLSDMSDIYASYFGKAISQLSSSSTIVTISKVKYDNKMFVKTRFNTTVAHIARGDATNNSTPRSAYIKIANAADIEVGETYTLKVTYKGSISLASNKTNRELVVRDGVTTSSTNADTVLARSTQNGTVVGSYSGAQEWTVDVTPAYGEDLFIGFYTNSEFPTADVYLGGLELIDEDGNDLAIALSDDTEFRNGSNITGAISRENGSTPTANYYAITEIVKIDDVADAEVKQDLVNAYYKGDSMLNITVGTSNNHHAVYKKVSASKLVAGAKYKLSIKYSGINFNKSDFILVRSGAETGGDEVLRSYNSTTGKFTEYEYYTEYVDYITVSDTPNDLYIGAYITKDTWAEANFYLDSIELIDIDGNNVVTPLSDMSDIYAAFSGKSINQVTPSYSSYNLFKINKLIYCQDKSVGSSEEEQEPPTENNTKVVHIARGNATNKDTARYIYFNIANAEDIVVGDTYTVKMTYVGSPSMTTTNNNRYLAIRQGEKGSGAQCLAICSNNVGSVTCDNYGTLKEENGAIKWTVDVTPTAAKTLSVCVYIGKSYTTADFYIGGIQVIDKNGKDVAVDLSEVTDFYNNASVANVNWYGKTDASYPTTNYFETCEVLTIAEVTDDTVKQTLKHVLLGITPEEDDGGNGGDDDDDDDNNQGEQQPPTEFNTKVAHIARGNATSKSTPRTIYIQIANAADIVVGETYTFKMTYTGTPELTNSKTNRRLVVRDGTTTANTNANTVLADSYQGAAIVTDEAGAQVWTVDITPAYGNDLFFGFYTNSEYPGTNMYIGGIQLIDKDGKNIAIPLSEGIEFRNGSAIDGNIYKQDSANLTSNYYETFEVINISDVTNDTAKQTLKYSLLGATADDEPAILKYSVGPTNESYMVYKKVPASRLVAGTRYKLSIKYSGFNFGKSDYIIVRDDAAKDTGSLLESRNSASGTFLEHTNYDEYIDFITVPDTPKDLYIGFYLRKTVWETANVYIGAITLTDMNGNNVVSSLGNMTDLYGSFWGKDIKRMVEGSGPSNYVKVEKLPYDEAMFPDDGIALPDFMLYGEYTGTADDSLVVEIPADKLTVGKKYVAEFTSNMLTAQYDEDICFGIFGGPGEGGKTWSEIVYGSALVGGDFASSETNENIRKYTFTLTEKKYDKYYAGFYILGSDRTIKFYVTGLTVYEADNAVKTNLIPDDGASMVNWHSNTAAGTQEGLGASKFVLYEKGNLSLADDNFKQKTMLSLTRDVTQANSLKIPLKTAELLPNVDYVVSFNYKNYKEAASGVGVGIRISADEGYTYDPYTGEDTNPDIPNPGTEGLANTSANGTNVKELHKGSDDVYFVVRFTEGQLAKYPNIYLTFSFSGYTRVYITNMKVYQKNDPNKVSVLSKDDYSTDMLGCVQDTRAAASKNNEKYNFFGSSFVRYDESQFKKEFNIAGSYNKGDRIAYKLDKSQLIADREYKISLNYNFGKDIVLDKDISMVVFGDTNGADGVYADTVILDKFASVKSGKSDRSYTFKVTQEMLDKYDDIYVGFLFNKAVTNIDIDFANFVVENSASGLEVSTINPYSSKVTGWYTANEKLGATKMSYNFKTALIYGAQYPEYVFEEIDDGEWWNEKDVEVTAKDYNNTVKGIVIGVDGKPVKNAKIQFVSGTNTYEVVTDSKGAFSITNIVPGFYQLHWVDKKGELVSFEYGIDIEKECVITLSIKLDNLYETTVDETIEDAEPTGAIRGTVYTPQLKVVKGLRVYLGKLGYVVTDENGYFEFASVPVGDYELYTVLSNGQKYVFRTVEIKKDIDIATKLKYDPQVEAGTDADGSNIVLIIILIAAIVVMLGAGVVIVIIAAKNKKKASVSTED